MWSRRGCLIVLLTTVGCLLVQGTPHFGRSPVWANASAVTRSGPMEEVFFPQGTQVRVETWISDLEIPWSLVFLSDDRALVSERSGRIRLIAEGELRPEPYAVPDGVVHWGEGGLMGLAVHPEFPVEPYVYAMFTYRDQGRLRNKVIRLRHQGEQGIFDRTIIAGIPGGRNHNGGRIAFGPDGMLYITTGEIFDAELAQNLDSLGGKILRLTPDGEIPQDNPFGDSPIYSYGHRNPQGLAWHPETRDLFASEHGPSGEFGAFANDELNVIVKGGNYGWPEVIGRENRPSYINPVVLWKETTPPAGLAFHQGALFVATLRSNTLIRIVLEPTTDGAYMVHTIERWFARDHSNGAYGRIRDVVVGPDGSLYFTTSNRDGRGRPRPGDDNIYRVVPRE